MKITKPQPASMVRRGHVCTGPRRVPRSAMWAMTVLSVVALGAALATGVRLFGPEHDASYIPPESDRLQGWSELDWTVEYDGYGEVGVENNAASLKPQAVADPDQTSAALALAGDNGWTDYSLTAQMKLQEQLRRNSPPNAWETGWLLFRYQEKDRSYYLAHKTNGLELGKLVPPAGTGQVFLATAPAPPAEPGRWYDYRIDVQGPTIRIYVNGELYITYADTEDPILSGGVGLYTEDAHVYFRQPEAEFL